MDIADIAAAIVLTDADVAAVVMVAAFVAAVVATDVVVAVAIVVFADVFPFRFHVTLTTWIPSKGSLT